MLTKSRITTICRLAYPIAIGLSSQVVMAVIDLAMVGNLGENSIAAVGLASFCNFFVLAFVMGATPAVQGLVARRRGERSKDPESLPLIGGITISLLIGVPLSLLCHFLSPFIFSLISSDTHVSSIGVPFLEILSTSLVASGINAAFEGYWNGIEKPKVYMSVVLFMNCLNICLNYLFIFGKFGAPALGAAGAAVGTATSLFVGLIINFVLVTRRLRGKGPMFARPTSGLLLKVFQLGAPVIVQQFFYALGFIVFLWMVGKVSTSDLAGASVLIRIADILGILATAVGTTAATLVSRTIGEGDVNKAAEWAWDAAKIGVGVITFIGLPLLIWPHYFLSIFLSNPDTIAIAVIPLQLVAATSGIASLIFIFSYTLLSLGDGNRVILVSFSTQWLLFLPAVWVVGPYLKHGLLSMYIVQTIYGAIATVLIIAVWMDGRWKTIKL